VATDTGTITAPNVNKCALFLDTLFQSYSGITFIVCKTWVSLLRFHFLSDFCYKVRMILNRFLFQVEVEK
jgi:hypothetical protein